MSSEDPYALLELSPGASVSEIKQAYKKMALRWHPDRHFKAVDKEHAVSVFAEITSAYQTLLHDSERPLTAVGAKLRTRLPTPMPSCKSTSEYSQTNTSTTSSHIFPRNNSNSGSDTTFLSSLSGSLKPRHDYAVPAGSEYASFQATSNPNDYRKPVIVAETRQSPHIPTWSFPNSFRARGGVANVSSSRARIAVAIDGNSQLLGPGPPLQPLGSIGRLGEWMYSLPLTLEELFNGKHCQFCLVRQLLSGRSKNVIIAIDVPLGCRPGTKIHCRGVGNELPTGALQDVVFVIEEVPHPYFSRIEDDLYLDINLPWTDSLLHRPELVKAKAIDGKEIAFYIDYVRYKVLQGEILVKGAGMPIRDGVRVIGRSDLVIRWEIQPPPRKQHILYRFLHPRTKR